VETVVSGLEVPWALAFAPDGRLLVTERPGRIRVVAGGRLQPEPVATLPAVYASGESGLMGLALDPDFARTGHLYVCYTARGGGGLVQRAIGGGRVNRLSRLTLAGGRAGDERVLLDDMPGAATHDGCRVKFGPDGKLYVTMGDASDAHLAQRPDSPAGKIHRLEPDGSVPADNPFRRDGGAPSSVWSLGHRNPQGLAWDAAGRLYASEHGPSAHDEVNLVEPGKNYGWPEVSGRARSDGARFVDPVAESGDRDTWAPSGMAFLDGHLYVAGLRGQRLVRLTLAADGGVSAVTSLLAGVHGRLRDVVAGPDGALYVATSNRDGRGSPRPDDDRILRVVP
jgi:glucose/arabinose dehydrogenase